MGFVNDYDGIEECVVRATKHKAKELIGKAGLTLYDRDDVEQEIIIDLLTRLSKYNPKRARLITFISCIVDHKAAVIIADQTMEKHDWRLCAYSLNDRVVHEDDGSIELLELHDIGEYRNTTKRTIIDFLDLSIDLEIVIASLPFELRNLCKRLTIKNVTEISRDTGIPRTTLYDKIKKLQKLFEDRGLNEYL